MSIIFNFVKKLQKLLLVSALAITPFTLQATKDNPYQQMQQAADKTFSRLKNEQSAIRSNPERLRTVVQQELLPYVDIRYAGALVLGRYFRDATPEQKTAYFKAFEAYLAQVYGQALSMYTNQNYELSPAQELDNSNIVPIRITILESSGRAPIRLDFQWRKNSKTGEWKAFDMSAEGVSMITTKQNEWAATLRQGGVNALIKILNNAASQKITLEQNK